MKKPSDFLSNVANHPLLRIAGCDGKSYIKIKNTHTGACWRVTLEDIKQSPWSEIEGVLTHKHAPRQLSHMTRVVGYYSQIANWNRSKIAELKHRQKGDYCIDKAASA